MNVDVTKPCVFLVDDQIAVLKALSRLFTSAGLAVKSFSSAQDFLDYPDVEVASCIVLDLSMPDMDGMALQKALAVRGSITPIIFLTGHGNIPIGVQAMKFGAFDFLTKPVDGDKLLEVVQNAFKRNQQLCLERDERKNLLGRIASLTQREREVLALVVQGKLNKQMAAELGIVEKTIKIHRARVMMKMKVRSLASLVRLVDRVDI